MVEIIEDDSGDATQREKNGQAPSERLPPLPDQTPVDITRFQDGGMTKTLLRQPTDSFKPTDGDTVYIKYSAYLQATGDRFDSSDDHGGFVKFKIGEREVIRVLDQTAPTMCSGEMCRVECDHDYAYGHKGSGVDPNECPRPAAPVPPKAAVCYDMELLRWDYGEDVTWDLDKSVMRSRQVRGLLESRHPNEGSLVNVYLKGYYDGRMFLDDDFEFELGECTEVGLPEGIDIAVRKFKKHEQSLVLIKSKWGYGKDGNEKFDIPPFSELVFDITLNNCERAVDPWARGNYDKLKEAERLKAKGTQYFQKGKYQLALSKYDKMCDILSDMSQGSMDCLSGKGGLQNMPTFIGGGEIKVSAPTEAWGARQADRDALYVAARLNCSLCYLKLRQFANAKRDCDSALAENISDDATKIKAFYRRAQAKQAMNAFDEAMEDFEQVLELDPNNAAATQQIAQCKRERRAARDKDRGTYRNIFAKLAEKAVKEAQEEEDSDDE